MKIVRNVTNGTIKATAIISLLFLAASAQAQITFKPGLRAGVNLSHYTKGDYVYSNQGYYDYEGIFIPSTSYNANNDSYTSKTDFYVAFYGAVKFTKYYTLQPEIAYSNQGSNYRNEAGAEKKLNVSYLSFSVINKFSFTDKFNIHLGPALDFVADENFPAKNDVDLAVQLGAGFNITKNLGIEARVKKGFVTVIDFAGSDHSNVVFQFGATYTFDIQ